jgi:hypothetical protein
LLRSWLVVAVEDGHGFLIAAAEKRQKYRAPSLVMPWCSSVILWLEAKSMAKHI